jgi:hypothetical protein
MMSFIQLIRRKECWQEGTRARALRRMTRLDDVSERVLYLLVVCALSEHLPLPPSPSSRTTPCLTVRSASTPPKTPPSTPRAEHAPAARESFTSKAGAALKPDSEKSTTEHIGDTLKGKADSAASTAQPESEKSYTQQAGDAVSGNSNENSVRAPRSTHCVACN